ncbi:MAG: riboflavin synthase [Spirochaetaceae bacterium]|nr:riboflavin synthase [Spirochaetaceae bacterium]
MFTGIVEEKGTIKSIQPGVKSIRLAIEAEIVLGGLKIGDSVAVSGVCLTVTDISSNSFAADVMPETLRKSAFSNLKPGDVVNLERAMAANGRFGGHMVSGHIDGTGTIADIKREDNAVWVKIKASPDILKYVIDKGSIAIDGISLTIAKIEKDYFSVSLIPHTIKETTLLKKNIGDTVNLESDLVGKYIYKFLNFGKEENKTIDMEFLQKHGF